jgi:hypothetical protein
MSRTSLLLIVLSLSVTTLAAAAVDREWVLTREHGQVAAAPPLALRVGPRLAAEPVRPPSSPLELVEARGQFVPGVQTEAFGGVEAHPLIAKAGEILTRRLSPWAYGLYVTSVARSPDDQRRLMRERRTRGWAIPRSKHLMAGMAVDIGFIHRRVSSWRLRDKAEQVLREELTEEELSKLRVVREIRCVHVEIDTWRGREDLEERMQLLADIGALRSLPDDGYPVPRLSDYATDEERRRNNAQRPALALAW